MAPKINADYVLKILRDHGFQILDIPLRKVSQDLKILRISDAGDIL